jgi:hypothetical protein
MCVSCVGTHSALSVSCVGTHSALSVSCVGAHSALSVSCVNTHSALSLYTSLSSYAKLGKGPTRPKIFGKKACN